MRCIQATRVSAMTAISREDTVELLTPPRLPDHTLTFEEYLAWEGENQAVEWVNGEVRIVPPASVQHEDLVAFLSLLLRMYVKKHDLGKVLGSRIAMKLEAQRRGREPDILFLANERVHLLQKNYLDGPADVAVEITSPESIGRDRGEKFVEYEAAGVKEYWLIDPDRQQAEFYCLGSDGRYHLMPLEAGGVFRSQTIAGFWLCIDWLWQLPDEMDVLRQLGVV